MDEGITVSAMTGDLASEIIWIEGPGGVDRVPSSGHLPAM
jgi:hypothetical protein